MKKFFTLILALSLLLGCCAQAEIAIIGGAPEQLELNTPTMPSDELEFTALSFICSAHGYTHQSVGLTLSVQSWSMETIDAAQEISFEVRYEDFVFPGVCTSGESVPIEMLMNDTVSYSARIPNALIYGEEAEYAEYILTVSGKEYSLTAEQLLTIEGVSVSAGNGFFALLKPDGTLWTWGSNNFCQLGDGTTDSRFTPKPVLDNVASFSLGYNHGAAIRFDGTLWTWGFNALGQLGDGTTDNRSTPVQVLDDVVSLALSSDHSAAIRTDGSLWTWGFNDTSQLGTGSSANTAIPTQVLSNVVSVSSGYEHTIALLPDGALWGWGANTTRQLPGLSGNYQSVPKQLMPDVMKASAGSTHTAILRTDGSVYTTTDSGGLRWHMDNAIDVAAGRKCTLILDSAGTLWGCAHDEEGQPGAGTADSNPAVILENVIAFDVTFLCSIAVCTDGSVWTWGNGTVRSGDASDDGLSPVKLDINAFS